MFELVKPYVQMTRGFETCVKTKHPQNHDVQDLFGKCQFDHIETTEIGFILQKKLIKLL